MASVLRKRAHVRYSFDVHFMSQEEREIFKQRLKNVRQLLTRPGSLPLDNCSLFNVLCDIAEDQTEDKSPSLGASTADPENEEACFVGGTKSFMRNSSEFVQC